MKQFKFGCMIIIMIVGIMCFQNDFVLADMYEEQPQADFVLKEGKQNYSIDNGKLLVYFEYTSKMDGIYSFNVSGDSQGDLTVALNAKDERGFIIGHETYYDKNNNEKIALRKDEKVYLQVRFNHAYIKTTLSIDVTNDAISTVKVVLVDNSTGNAIKNVGKSNVEGLSWDAKTATLTMHDYIADNNIGIKMDSKDRGENVYVNIIGKNIFKNCKRVLNCYWGADIVTIIGDGELIIDNDELDKNDTSIYVNGSLFFDGPNIVYTGAYKAQIIGSAVLVILSGNMSFDLYPMIEDNEAYYGYIGGYSGFYMFEGNISFNIEETPENIRIRYDETSLIYSRFGIYILNGNIIVTGYDESVLKKFNIILNLDGKDTDTVISSNVKILVGKYIDINCFEFRLMEKTMVYDGKEKKPEVYNEYLKEGEDYSVEYRNNINVGKAEVIISGKGRYKGSLKFNFDIVSNSKENGKKNNTNNGDVVPNKALRHKVGEIVTDGKLIYKIMKYISKNNILYGEVAVTGVKKKSLRKIKIADKIIIDGITYNITSIAKKAFKGNKKITQVIIGKNVTTIGAQAFVNVKKLKKVIIKSKKISKIGKKAFTRKVGKKVIFKVNKENKIVYKKLLKRAKTNKYIVK